MLCCLKWPENCRLYINRERSESAKIHCTLLVEIKQLTEQPENV
jgi:hypothetical protein